MERIYTNEQLISLIAEVEKEFAPILAKAQEEESTKLSKSEDAPKEKDEKKDKEESDGASDKKMESEKPEDKGVKDQHQQDNSKDDKGQPMESKEERVAEDKKENAKPSEDPHGDAQDHGYDDEDMQHMHSMYSSMSKGELKAHHDSIRKVMDGMGLAKCEDGMAKAAPASGEKALEKSEKDIVLVTDEVALLKSELDTFKAKNEEQEKTLKGLEEFLTKFVEKTTVPAGKAITSLDVIAKTENTKEDKPLSKSEIDSKLLAKANDRSLSKSDRDAINSYYFSKNIEKVRHLLS